MEKNKVVADRSAGCLLSKVIENVSFRGYTKKEGQVWVAVCIDLNIAAQGATSDEATRECQEMIDEYLLYVCSTYPKELHKYIPRPAPQELIEEWRAIVARVFTPLRKNAPRKATTPRPVSFVDGAGLASSRT